MELWRHWGEREGRARLWAALAGPILNLPYRTLGTDQRHALRVSIHG